MKRLSILIIIFMPAIIFCQDSIDVSGEWVGYRFQYDQKKKKYESEFDYRYQLSQIGQKVVGVVKIKNKQGKFADIAVKGFVQGDKFYFEEYEILNATRSNGFLWCLKKGVLDIVKKNYDEYALKGITTSSAENNSGECTGGYSYMSRKTEEISEGLVQYVLTPDTIERMHEITVYPNPFSTNTTVSFKLLESNNIIADIIDINGTVINTLVDNALLNSGTHSYTFIPSTSYQVPCFFYLRLRIGDKIYTRVIQKN